MFQPFAVKEVTVLKMKILIKYLTLNSECCNLFCNSA